jgi:ketosteroid isomerase-like protein
MDPSELVREAFRGLDEPGGRPFLELLADDAEMVTPLGTFQGRETITPFIQGMHAAFSDWLHEVDVQAAGNLVVAEGTWNATHSGPLRSPQGEVGATHRRVSVPFVGVVRVRDGRIESIHNYFDQMGFLSQLGLVPEQAPA